MMIFTFFLPKKRRRSAIAKKSEMLCAVACLFLFLGACIRFGIVVIKLFTFNYRDDKREEQPRDKKFATWTK